MTTSTNEDGSTLYRRRPTDEVIYTSDGRYRVTNQDVVPYNPYLLNRFNAHINVELCTSLGSIKYLFMYIHKGNIPLNIFNE